MLDVCHRLSDPLFQHVRADWDCCDFGPAGSRRCCPCNSRNNSFHRLPCLALVSGFLEFSVSAGDYAQTWPFRVKMLVVLAAIIFTIIVRRDVPKWERLPAVPISAKILAAVSLVLWIGSILAGTEIAFLTGLG